MSTPQKPTETPKPDEPNEPTGDSSKRDSPPSDDAKSTTAAAIVSEDKDRFPAGDTSAPQNNPPPAGTPPAPAPAPHSAARNLGGRPKGKKDSKPRGRPNRPDWPNPKPNDASNPEFEVVDDEPAKAPPNYHAMAEMLFDMTTGGILVPVLGPEWMPRASPRPELPSERDFMVERLEVYFESQELPDIPPGIFLLLAIATYAAPRFAQPSTKEKVKGMFTWAKEKMGGLFRKRKQLPPAPPATEPSRPDNRMAQGTHTPRPAAAPAAKTPDKPAEPGKAAPVDFRDALEAEESDGG
jgi:hypothetical protein